jgi:prepilin peptidase CpaA
MNSSLASIAPTLVATLILATGVVDDFLVRKFHNWLFLTCLAVALITSVLLGGWQGLNSAVIGFIAGLACMLPLVLMGIVGAGDMKLLAAFGTVAGWSATVNVAVYSLIWGAVFGVFQVLLNKQFASTIKNMVSIASFKERQTLQLHKMPFTAALIVGWLTHLVQMKVLK